MLYNETRVTFESKCDDKVGLWRQDLTSDAQDCKAESPTVDFRVILKALKLLTVGWEFTCRECC